MQHEAAECNPYNRVLQFWHSRALNGVGAGLIEWAVTSPSEAVFECLLVFNQSGVDLESFSGAYRSRKCFG